MTNNDSSTGKSLGTGGLETLFDEIAALIRTTPATPDLHVSDTDKLRMYGLYKQATEGPLSAAGQGVGDAVQPPSRFQLVARAKYCAWQDCSNMTIKQAMLAYVELAASQDHWLGKQCAQKLLEWKQSNEVDTTLESTNDQSDASSSSSISAEEEHRSKSTTTLDDSFANTQETFNTRPTTKLLSWLETHFGVRPLIPRGQLDISYGDLAFALWQCLWSSSSMSRYCHLEQQVSQLWAGTTECSSSSVVMTGLSVRSLLDLYLRVASFPEKSEIVMTPPINIPGMMDVLRHHNINVVPVDIPEGKDGKTVVSVDVDAVKDAITSETVAIMIVHPFGMISTTSEDMKQLRALADRHHLHVLEDCAECFTGLGPDCYTGSPEADMTLFSFGLIKTATALGGGLAIVRNALKDEASSNMNRIHHSLYKQQSATAYLWKVLWCILVRFIADCPLLYGSIFALCSWIGLDFDAIVTSSTRGFSPMDGAEDRRLSTVFGDSKRQSRFMRQLRQRPSTALLSLLMRRLERSQTSVLSVKSRVEQCLHMTSMLEQLAPDVKWPLAVSKSANTFWLFPIQVDEPDLVSHRLCMQGFDVPRGLSQLELISTNSSDRETCPRSRTLMRHALYLPVSNRSVSEKDMRRMAGALRTTATTPSDCVFAAERESSCHVCRSFREARQSFPRLTSFAAFSIICISVDALIFLRVPLSGIMFSAACCMLKLFTVAMSVVVSAVVAIRCIMADFYLQSSDCFAKYSSMFFTTDPTISKNVGEDALQNGRPLLNMDVLRVPALGDRAQEGVVLLTGATGFIGSLVLRDLLLNRIHLSISGGVVVICRSKRGKSPQDRITNLLEDPMYSFLSAVEKQRLVHVIEGDVSQPGAGLSKNDIDEICNSLDITHVIHCAASVSFTQTMKDAAVSNITSSLNLQSLTGRLKSKSARYVHISTAFVHGGMTGTKYNPLPEQLHSLDGYDAADLYRSMLGTEYIASVAMNVLDFPNTYTFSKCICEHLLARSKNVPTVVIRPSIVGPAVTQPHEGWAGRRPTTIVAAACLYMSYQWNLWYFGKHKVPYIPVDVVSRFVIAKAFAEVAGVRSAAFRECETPEASTSDDGFERVSQMSDSSLSGVGDVLVSTPGFVEENDVERFAIHNCAWDSESPDSAMFSWIDYAVAVVHVGAALGHFSRLAAYVGLLLTVRILPGMNMKEGTFRNLHHVLVQRPIEQIVSWFNLAGRSPRFDKLTKLSPFLDLPLLFFQFMNNDFYFASDLVAPVDLDGERYLFSCAVAAERFVTSLKASDEKETTSHPSRGIPAKAARCPVVTIGGAADRPVSNDVWWTLAQPQGGFFVRLAGWMFRKVLRASSVDVTVDVESFSRAALAKSSANSGTHLVLAPSHRSFFDFFLISYICFALPELQIVVPTIAAAEDFERLPCIGWLAAKANAFFLKRGRGKVDPALRVTLESLKEECGDEGVCLEVFVEGSRSRDRRYLRPRTGLIRCLAEIGGDLLVVPISINYEEIPEQACFSVEVEKGNRSNMNIQGLFIWLKKVFSGKVNLGRIHVTAASPILVSGGKENDLPTVCEEIQRRQQQFVYISQYHILATSEALGLSAEATKLALTKVGCRSWPDSCNFGDCSTCEALIDAPMSQSEKWIVLLHCGHKLSPFFLMSHPKWSKWLNSVGQSKEVSVGEQCPSVRALLHALGKSFDKADEYVDQALSRLLENGFERPESEHIFQCIQKDPVNCPTLLLRAAISLKLDDDSLMRIESIPRSDAPPSDHEVVVDEETLGFWGFRDSGFMLQMDSNGETTVTMKGARYGICGKPLKMLIPFIEQETNCRIDPLQESLRRYAVLDSLSCDLREDDIDILKAVVTRVSISASDRVRHGSGHSQEDVYLIRSGTVKTVRLPDAVVWPSSEDEVELLISTAKAKDWCLIPFGGGTNVSHATRCPAKDVEPRPILSVDMRLMDHVLWVNEEDGLASVQAGITGRALVEEMARRGYTIGHEPDSIEFSTLGGWIATKASGMKRNKYGNIEDIVKSVRVAGSNGLLWRGQTNVDGTGACGRESRGMDLLSVAFGSEGSIGIITSAVLRIWPLPECREYESIVLADFDDGLRLVQDVARLGPSLPSSVRLLDNDHFRLGQSLQVGGTLLERGLSRVWKMVHPLARSWSSESVVCATIVFEGTKEEVESQRHAIKKLASRHGGTCMGARIGKSGYDLTFAIAYLRDFALTYNFLAESFETFAPWSKVKVIIEATRSRIKKEHRLRCLPGEPFVGARVTQLYHEGACVYFYFCMSIRNVKNPSSVFSDIEHAARQEILDHGGSLSHHHGIGKVRSEFAKQLDSGSYRSFVKSLKKGVDPSNTFGARNGALG